MAAHRHSGQALNACFTLFGKKMNIITLRFCLTSLLMVLPFYTSAQERALCEAGTIHATDSACQRLQALHKKYSATVSRAEHQALYRALVDFRNSPEILDSATQIVGENLIEQALMLWLDWYQVAIVAREENQQLLETESWRKVLALAHRDPYATLKRLNTAGKAVDDHDSVMRLLLAGMITNNLRVLAEVAYAHPSIDVQEIQSLEAYVNAHKQDFNTGETCYGANYNGRHFSAVEKRYPSSSYAQAAAYLAMTITPCGECEGELTCYLSNRLIPTQQFLSKYPTSNYVAMLLKRVQNAIPLALGEKETQADYLSASDKYVPLDVAHVLLSFEGYLKNLAPADQISIKVTLADWYIKLNQAGNAKRIVDWLVTQAADTPDLVRLKLAVSNMKKFALSLSKPKPYGPNMLALEWTVRNAASETPMQLWRSESPEFSQPIAIGAVLPKGSLKVVDTTVQSDTAYWYRLESVGDNRIALSHTAFAQTWSSQAHLQEIIFDQVSKTLFAIGRLPENYVSRVLLRFPKSLNQNGDIKNLKPLFSSPMKPDTWWVDKDSNTILLADTAGVIASTLNLAAPNKTEYTRSEPHQGATIDLSKKQVLRVTGGLIARSQDGKFVYVWDKKGKLLRTDFSGEILEVIFEEATIAMPWKDKFEAFYLMVRRNGEVFLIGKKQSPLAGTLFTLRKLSRAGYTDLDVAGRPSYYISSPNVWFYDSQQDGLWVADYEGRPSLFGLDGKLIKTVSTKLDKGGSFVNGSSLAFDKDAGELYVASSSQIIRVNRLGKTDLVWEKKETHPGGQLLQAKLITDREKALEQYYTFKKCELDQEWLGQAAIACQERN
jgi:hypothetical protein